MIEEAQGQETMPELAQRSLLTPDRITFAAMWLLITVPLIVMLFSGVRNTGQFRTERFILQIAYGGFLLWYLSRTGPSVQRLTDLSPVLLPKRTIGRLVPVIVLALLLVAAFSGGIGLVNLLLIIASIWVLLVWRSDIRLPNILLGLVLTLIAFLGGFPLWENQFIGDALFWGLLLFVAPMFVAGGLLVKRTGMGGSQLSLGQYETALFSFLTGCLMFVPFGLFNAASGSPVTGITWVTHWWMPLSTPWFSAIAEEAVFRLFLVTLCYLVLRPAFNNTPTIAVVLAVLFSGIVFGIGHGGSIMNRFLITGMLYGLPMAVVYAKRDWEHAVGAHYMINLIPMTLVFLET